MKFGNTRDMDSILKESKPQLRGVQIFAQTAAFRSPFLEAGFFLRAAEIRV